MAIANSLPQPNIIPPDIQSPLLSPSPLTTVDFGLDGMPVVTLHQLGDFQEQESQKPKHFDDNLAKDISDMDLNTIAADLIEGIDADISSRKDWIQNYEAGMDLLGLKLEPSPTPGQTGSGKNISRVRHPLLLWAVIKGQSMARAELLPAAGPVKVVIETDETPELETKANALEQDLNYYLTVSASEYYPDMDRGLFYLYYGGTLFKKVYRCPIRNRPVSDCIYMPDLIVSNDATDIQTALRVTHSIKMPQSVMDQLQDQGFYLDVSLGQAIGQPSSADLKTGQVIGLAPEKTRPKDKPYTVWECYTTYDLTKYGITQPDDRPIPYRISIDKDSRKVLEIRRNWKPDDKDLLKASRPFVKYGLVPGFGFLDLGFLHILGNHTKALTALWRICIDAGMMSTMPGGLKLKGARTSTNEYTPGPGEFPEVDGSSGITDIRQMIMPLPFKEPSAVLLQMIGDLASDGEKMAGTVDMEVGEGRTNVPVGTIMSMIEQQTQVMAACHKRMHTAQQEEFWLLKDLFAENPEDLLREVPNAASAGLAAEDFRNLSLVPASDPNVPAAMHRRMQAMTFLQIIQMAGPAAMQLFDIPTSLEWVLQQGVGMSDAKRFINPQLLNPAGAQTGAPGQPQQGAGDQSAALAAAASQDAQMQNQTRMADIASKGQQAQGRLGLDTQKLGADTSQKEKDRQAKMAIVQEQEKTKRLKIIADTAKHADTQKADAVKLGHQAKKDFMPPPFGAPPNG